jgi:hypothetical protein
MRAKAGMMSSTLSRAPSRGVNAVAKSNAKTPDGPLWRTERSFQRGMKIMSIKKVYLYAEIQVSAPFEKVDWPSINESMKKEKGLKSKTWLAGVNTNTIGGFYEFDSLENAKAYAGGYLAKAAEQLGGSLTVRLYDGDVVAEASRGIDSPFYSAVETAAKGRDAA